MKTLKTPVGTAGSAVRHLFALGVAAALITLSVGCESMRGLAFGLDVANAETTISVSYADGKGVVAAEQGGNRIGFNVRR